VHETTSIDEIIALAGGLNEKDPSSKVRYLHIRGQDGAGIIRLADYHSGIQTLDPHWQGGERLFFQTDAPLFTYSSPKDSSIVRIMGQVRAPAEYAVKPGATFFTYLLQAGGPTDRADLANITLIRSDTNSTRARTFNSQNFHDVPPIEPGDTLIVNADVATPAEKSTRVAASIASVLTSLSMLAIAML
jgi:protein involved in polysaccharide export with SLBB domain